MWQFFSIRVLSFHACSRVGIAWGQVQIRQTIFSDQFEDKKLHNLTFNTYADAVLIRIIYYGSTDYGVSSPRIQNQKDFCLQINIGSQRKLLNFENWFSGELSNIGHHFCNIGFNCLSIGLILTIYVLNFGTF